MKYEKIIANIKVWQLFLAAFLLSGIIAFINPYPATDTLTRYAPAAEAFAAGNWNYAFHPRFGVYFTSLAGVIVMLLDITGSGACKIVSILFFSLSVFPLHRLFLMIWGKKIAVIGVILYTFCSHLLRYAADGVRDNGKTLALALAACGLVELTRRSSWHACFLLSGGCALLTVIRGEGALIALFCLVWGIILLRKDWKKIISAPALCFLLILPQLYYNYLVIGYPVPELRHAVLLDKIGIHFHDAPVKIPETAR